MIFRSGEGQASVHARYRELLADWPVPSKQRMLDSREGPTFVVSSGPADAPPLVLLHGSGGTTLDWSGDVAAWSEHFQVHAIDLIGEPGLSAPSRPQLGSDDYASWLDDVLAGLGVDRFSMAAVSLGGWFALDYAIRRPGRVERLALLTPAGIGRQKNWVFLPALLLMPFGEWGLRRTMELVAGPIPAGIPAEYGLFALLVHRHFNARRVKLPLFTDEQLEKLDLLVIVGGRDRMLDSHVTQRRLPDRTVLLPEAGHILPPQTERVLNYLKANQ